MIDVWLYQGISQLFRVSSQLTEYYDINQR